MEIYKKMYQIVGVVSAWNAGFAKLKEEKMKKPCRMSIGSILHVEFKKMSLMFRVKEHTDGTRSGQREGHLRWNTVRAEGRTSAS